MTEVATVNCNQIKDNVSVVNKLNHVFNSHSLRQSLLKLIIPKIVQIVDSNVVPMIKKLVLENPEAFFDATINSSNKKIHSIFPSQKDKLVQSDPLIDQVLSLIPFGQMDLKNCIESIVTVRGESLCQNQGQKKAKGFELNSSLSSDQQSPLNPIASSSFKFDITSKFSKSTIKSKIQKNKNQSKFSQQSSSKQAFQIQKASSQSNAQISQYPEKSQIQESSLFQDCMGEAIKKQNSSDVDGEVEKNFEQLFQSQSKIQKPHKNPFLISNIKSTTAQQPKSLFFDKQKQQAFDQLEKFLQEKKKKDQFLKETLKIQQHNSQKPYHVIKNATNGFNFQAVPKVNLSNQHKQNQMKLTQGFFKDFEHWVLDNDPAAPACQEANIFLQKPSAQAQLSWGLNGSVTSMATSIMNQNSLTTHHPVQPMIFGQSSMSTTSTASSSTSNAGDTALTSSSSLFKPFHEFMGIGHPDSGKSQSNISKPPAFIEWQPTSSAVTDKKIAMQKVSEQNKQLIKELNEIDELQNNHNKNLASTEVAQKKIYPIFAISHESKQVPQSVIEQLEKENQKIISQKLSNTDKIKNE